MARIAVIGGTGYAGSNIVACSIGNLPGAAAALALEGNNKEGYAPLIEAIADRYGVEPEQVTTAQGSSLHWPLTGTQICPGQGLPWSWHRLVTQAPVVGLQTCVFEQVATPAHLSTWQLPSMHRCP